MHPFYESQARLLAGRPVPASGLVSMAAYLVFWGMVVVALRRDLDSRFPRVDAEPPTDPALVVLRERFARGEIDEEEFRTRLAVLSPPPGGRRARRR